MITVKEYIDAAGNAPFGDWADGLSAAADAKVALERMAQGNFSSAKGVGQGVFEHRIDFGPGYRIYFGKDGDRIVVLLRGGTKKRQQRDIENATNNWQDYKRRKRHGAD
jgi:putative addiction module killer protein